MTARNSVKTAVTTVLSAAVMTVALSAAAQATAARTFVSSTGNDGNAAANCPLASPCRSFAAAYPVTSTGGDIFALDSAGYGSVTITSAVTIVGVQPAGVTIASGTTGITINAAANDVVILRNLLITGNGAANTIGIQLNTGRLILEDSTVRQVTTGLAVVSSKADVVNSDFLGNTTAISTTGIGVDGQANPIVGPTQVRISRGNVIDNTTAYVMNGPGARPSPATDNKITIFLRVTDNSSAAINVNQTGNGTLVSGTGVGCTTAGNCQSVATYGVGVNGNMN